MKRRKQGNLFEDPEIEITKQKLKQVRRLHFEAKSAKTKRDLRNEDHLLRSNLVKLLAENNDFAPEDACQLASWNPYDQNSVSSFFDPEWMFGLTDGFDIVIGNPPYIQLQNNAGKLANLYEKSGYRTFERKGDIYCLFYERGHQLLKAGGHLCFITSNKWMRAGYGKKTRDFLAKNTNPILLIDFAGVKVFDSATVDTNILLFSQEPNQHKTLCTCASKQDKNSIKNLSVFVQQNAVSNNFATSDSWVILSPIERSIKRKIESIGTPLKDWDIRIYRGILTGCNEAFIISSQKRNEILANCANEAERQRTAELIRPILRGRDIKRYGYMDNGLYLINIHNGIRGRIPRIKIEDYPAVKAHLDQYWDKIEKRADQGDTPYNLRNCAYLEDFSKPKLFYPDISQNLTFALCQEKVFCNNTVYFFSSKSEKLLEYLASVLNTKLMDWYYRTISVQLGSCAVRMFSIYVLNLPVPKKVSGSLYETLSLTKEEIAFIESQ